MFFWGIPDNIPEYKISTFRSRVIRGYEEMCEGLKEPPSYVVFGDEKAVRELISEKKNNEETTSGTFQTLARTPLYTFEQLVLPNSIRQEIESSIQLLNVEKLVFDDWGLRAIEPNPKTALNFYGPPGTGKTMAAHAIASFLGKKIIVASYAEIESKYHGDGPKNVKAIFAAAEKEKAVLFIDEADSLLSRRLTNVTQGSEQAINSMRSQLLINMEAFHGICIFSTNLIQNYDKAFETRIRHIQFSLPDKEQRKQIWEQHLVKGLPLAEDISLDTLVTETEGLCGRDIKNSVIQCAVNAAVNKVERITDSMLVEEVHKIRISHNKIKEHSSEGRPCTEEEKNELTKTIRAKIKTGEISFEK